MKNIAIVILSVMLLSACGNDKRQAKQIVNEGKRIVERTELDTVGASYKEEVTKVEDKSSATVISPSSSRSHKTSNNDNMRGFDPASEDDMDDNGMSRYMENNDDEGWD